MMFDLSTRLLVAYGLIALMVLAAGAIILRWRHNSPHRRNLRARRRTEHYRQLRRAAASGGDEPGLS